MLLLNLKKILTMSDAPKISKRRKGKGRKKEKKKCEIRKKNQVAIGLI